EGQRLGVGVEISRLLEARNFEHSVRKSTQQTRRPDDHDVAAGYVMQAGALPRPQRARRHILYVLERYKPVTFTPPRFLLHLVPIALVLLEDRQHIFGSPGIGKGDVDNPTGFHSLELDRHGTPRIALDELWLLSNKTRWTPKTFRTL